MGIDMRLLIYGSKEFAATIAELVLNCGHHVEGFVDDFKTGPTVLGTFDRVVNSHPPATFGMVVAIGYAALDARWVAWLRVKAAGYPTPALIHPLAYVADSATVADGCILMAAAIVDVRSQIGQAVVVWPGACINHDCIVGSNSFVSPNATLCGHVHLGANCFVGAGAAIVDHCTVPPNTRIGMLARYTGTTA